MKTLVCSQNYPPLHLAKPSPSKTNLQPTITLNPSLSIKHWRCHANAKGFSGATPIKESTANKKIPNKNNRNDDDEEIPQVVFDRMITRILVSVGVPMGAGFASLYIFGVLKAQQLWNVPAWLQFLTTFVTFGTSALGLAYGSLSTSWDPEKKGSVLGWEEAQKNWVEMWKEDEK